MQEFAAYLARIDAVRGDLILNAVRNRIGKMDADMQSICALAAAEKCTDINAFDYFIKLAYDTSSSADEGSQCMIGYEMCRLACGLHFKISATSAEQREDIQNKREMTLLQGASVIVTSMASLFPMQIFERARGLIETAREDHVSVLLPIFGDLAHDAIDACNVSDAEKVKMRWVVQQDISTDTQPSYAPQSAANDPVFAP